MYTQMSLNCVFPPPYLYNATLQLCNTPQILDCCRWEFLYKIHKNKNIYNICKEHQNVRTKYNAQKLSEFRHKQARAVPTKIMIITVHTTRAFIFNPHLFKPNCSLNWVAELRSWLQGSVSTAAFELPLTLYIHVHSLKLHQKRQQTLVALVYMCKHHVSLRKKTRTLCICTCAWRKKTSEVWISPERECQKDVEIIFFALLPWICMLI